MFGHFFLFKYSTFYICSQISFPDKGLEQLRSSPLERSSNRRLRMSEADERERIAESPVLEKPERIF